MRYPGQAKLDWIDLPPNFPGFADPDRWLPMLQRHFALLSAAAPAINTTSVAEAEAPARLYAESLETLRLASLHGDFGHVERYVDVGSGGGFPGMVAAVLFPEWHTTLVEAHGRKAALLQSIATELGLANVTAIHARAEEAGRGPLRDSAGLVTLRAVAELRVALEYAVPLARRGGLVALPKGSRLPDEEKVAGRAMSALKVEVLGREAMRPELSATPWTLVLRKAGPTIATYPRRPGIPAHEPL